MPDSHTPAPVDRLTELVAHLSGAPGEAARGAVENAVERNGGWGDHLLNVADALLAVRGDDDADDVVRPRSDHRPAAASA